MKVVPRLALVGGLLCELERMYKLLNLHAAQKFLLLARESLWRNLFAHELLVVGNVLLSTKFPLIFSMILSLRLNLSEFITRYLNFD
jgi:hypothetical protein